MEHELELASVNERCQFYLELHNEKCINQAKRGLFGKSVTVNAQNLLIMSSPRQIHDCPKTQRTQRYVNYPKICLGLTAFTKFLT